MHMIKKMIEDEDFFHFHQNLYWIDNWRKVGSEILLRSNSETPDIIFQTAKSANRLFELETISIMKALQTYTCQEFTPADLLFINIFPSTITHPDFPAFMKELAGRYSSFTGNIVFEIIETEKIDDIPFLKDRTKLLLDHGLRIAIDDVGRGWSSLSVIIELEPSFIKLDQYFSNGLTESRRKQEMIKALLLYCNYTNTLSVLEGVENQTDLATAKFLGVHICQGYILDKPKPLKESGARKGRFSNIYIPNENS